MKRNVTERLCKCHGVPMVWTSDCSNRKGGTWRCPIRVREIARAADRRRAASPKRQRQLAEARKRYEETRIQVRVAGASTSYRVRPESRDSLVERLEAFRAAQKAESEPVAQNA